MLAIEPLEQLVNELTRLPGIGRKSAQRLAYHFLRSSSEGVQKLTEALVRVKGEIRQCQECYNYTDQRVCHYCSDPHRNSEVLCVVEEPLHILRVEGSGVFKGRYHVLHGVISPLDGVSPSDLRIQELLQRVVQQGVREVIFALDTDLEGDATVLYISRLLQNNSPDAQSLRLSRIAQGVPLGSDLDFVDDRTMGRALENRTSL